MTTALSFPRIPPFFSFRKFDKATRYIKEESIEICRLRSRINFVKKSYEVKSFLILLKFSEDVAYDIKMIF